MQITTGERGEAIARSGRIAEDDDDFAGGADFLIVVVMAGRRRDAVADEHQGRAHVTGGGNAHGLKVTPNFQLNLLTLWPVKHQDWGGLQLGSRHGEGLKITSIRRGGLEAGFLKLVGDVLGGEVDPRGVDSASFTLIGSQEVDVVT